MLSSRACVAIAALEVLTACSCPKPTGATDGGLGGGPDAGADGATDAGVDAGPAAFPAFALGTEYTPPGLAAAYAGTGTRWAKTQLEAFTWGESEPTAPVAGTHTYDWSCPDAMIAGYEAAGFELQSYLSPRSPWGSVGASDVMPQAQYLTDYRAWVRALVERYDGDGVDDMPGLVRPVRFWVVGGEWSGFWPSGNAADYLTLLAATRDEARAASPAVQLGAIPFLLFDVFQGDVPTDAQIAARLADPPPAWRKSTAGLLQILDRPDLFDFVDVHSLGDYTELPPELAWFRAQMAQRGYSRPIWVDDAFPIGYLANNFGWPPLQPVTAANQAAVFGLLRDVAKLQEPAYTTAVAWIRAETAKGTIQKVATALGEGAVGINLGNTEDWMADTGPALRDATVALLGASAMMGMIDVVHAAGSATCAARTAGAPRPARVDFELLAAKLGDAPFDSVVRLALADPGVRGYAMTRGARRLWLLWYEDRVLQLPDASETPVGVSLPMPSDVTVALVTTAVTDPSALGPSVTTLPVAGGAVTLELTSVPVFVEPSP